MMAYALIPPSQGREMLEPFTLRDLPALRTALRALDSAAYASFTGRLLALPEWFNHALDPMPRAYRDQQMRLWSSISEHGLAYDPDRDEQFDDREGSDVVASPGFFRARGLEPSTPPVTT